MRIVSVDQMRELERRTFAQGLSEDELQRRAGSEVARVVAALRTEPGTALALVGTGNNGRDAWIAAERLLERRWGAALYLCPRHSIADRELHHFEALGGRLFWCAPEDVEGSLSRAAQGASVILDGLLGIGARGAPRAPLDGIIQALNAQRAKDQSLCVVAVDNPSGLDPDTGTAAGVVIIADVTIVLGGLKRGLVNAPATKFTGELRLGEIGVVDGPPGAPEVLSPATLQGLLPPRPVDAHKGTFGRLLVVAGSEQYVGAAYLVCGAAVRSGAGIVTLAAPRWLRDVVAARLPEITYLPLPEGGPAGDGPACIERISSRLKSFDALAIGPGLSTEGTVPELVESVLKLAGEIGIPAAVDADALNVLASRPGWTDWIARNLVLTPHPGELARLLGGAAPASEPAWELARRLGEEWGLTVALKGALTAIGSPQGAWVHPHPNPGLATAGTGDVLTGIIGGLLARGMDPTTAARLGVWVHGRAGSVATAGLAGGGLAASDLLREIPGALAEVVKVRAAL